MSTVAPRPQAQRTPSKLFTGHVRTSNAEIAAWDPNTERLAGETDLGDLPIAVITAGSAPGTPDGFIEFDHARYYGAMPRSLAARSSFDRAGKEPS